MRRKIDIPEKKLRAIMRLKPTLKDCAAFFDCSEDSIERYCKKLGAASFAEFREQNMVYTRFSLIRTALAQAETGNTAMLIFCLKNLCGWLDRFDNTTKIITQELEAKSTKEVAKLALDTMKKLNIDIKEIDREQHPTSVT